jgi:CHAT domain-containing protein
VIKPTRNPDPEEKASVNCSSQRISVPGLPFFALPIRGKDLVDRMSVTIAPGFFVFGRQPALARSEFRSPIVVGDPQYPRLEPLPGARDEANTIAGLLHTDARVGEAARSRDLLAALRTRAALVDFILLSTHGSANDVDPIDGSYLSFSDEPLTARELSGLREKLPGPRQCRSG